MKINGRSLNTSRGASSINFTTADSQKMTILPNGNVGIGTIEPNSKLDVNGSTIITGSLTVTDGIIGGITGNASTATTLAAGKTIGMTGDVTWTSAAFNGSTNVTGTSTLANSGVTVGTYTKVTVDAKGRTTAGTVLSATDIPNLDAAKITTGTIDAARLPSYVDDVLEYTNLAGFPATGETGKIYVDITTNKIYRWSGTVYIEISAQAGTAWGGITGTLSNQTDLQNALNLKANLASPTFTGVVTSPSFVGALTGNATTATNVAYSGLTGTVPTWNQSTTGNAATATLVTGTSGQLQTKDDRIIEPNSITTGRLQFGFTSWGNNNSSPYADYLHLRSYSDGSGGNDNLVMFRKDAIGMRIWQHSYGSATAYSSYKDVAWTDGTNATGTWGIGISGNAATATTASYALTSSFLNGGTNAFVQGGNSFGTTATLGTNDNNSLALETSGSTRMFISSSGNVGIGTTAPTLLFQVGARAGIGSDGVFYWGSALTGNNRGFLSWNTDIASINTPSNLTFNTGVGSTERMRITSAGNVNIGGNYTSTTNTLQVTGNAAIGYTNAAPTNGLLVAGNVGIGTASPNTKLQVSALNSEYVNLTAGLSVVKMEEGYGMYMGVAPSGNGWIQAATYNNGTKYNLILNGAGGNVGIGTTTPSATLHIQKGDATILAENPAGGKFVQLMGGSNVSGISYDNSAKFHIYSQPNANKGTFGNVTSVLTVDSGNVGIGTTTPNAKLDVNGNAIITGSLTTTAATYVGGNLSVGTTYNGFAANIAGTLYVIGGNTYVNDGYGHVNSSAGTTGFFPYSNKNIEINSNSVTAIFVTGSNQNVGIGTITPSSKLHLSVGNLDGIRVESSNSGYLETGKTGGARWRWANEYQAANLFELLVNDLAGGTPNTSVLAISGSGNVGIGTSTPNAKLHVNGNTNISGVITATGGNSTNWNTAFGWGNHASAGYLTSYTDTNTTYTAGTSLTLTGTIFSVTANGIGATQLNVTGNGTTSQYLRSDGDGTFTWATPTDTNTVYTHPAYTARNIDTSGAQVIDIITSDAIGSVTNITTRTLTLADIGAAATTHYHDRLYNASSPSQGYLSLSSGNELEYFNSSGVLDTLYLQYSGTPSQLVGPGGAQIWMASNDGAGSGLDADLLDGNHASAFQSALTNPVTGTGADNRVALWSGTTTQDSDANLTWNGTTFNVGGTLTATVKSFIIDHPTKQGKKLQYGVLEGPEHSVYVRGKLTNTNTIILPDHWHALVHEDTITVNLTSIGKKQDLWVEEVNAYQIEVGSQNEINCFYTVFAERKDVDKLVTEFDK